MGSFVAPLFRQGWTMEHQDGSPVDALPTYYAPVEAGQRAEYPLTMLSPKPHAYLNSQYGNMANQTKVQGQQTCTAERASG